jgi:hypothetical protein
LPFKLPCQIDTKVLICLTIWDGIVQSPRANVVGGPYMYGRRNSNRQTDCDKGQRQAGLIEGKKLLLLWNSEESLPKTAERLDFVPRGSHRACCMKHRKIHLKQEMFLGLCEYRLFVSGS